MSYLTNSVQQPLPQMQRQGSAQFGNAPKEEPSSGLADESMRARISHVVSQPHSHPKGKKKDASGFQRISNESSKLGVGSGAGLVMQQSIESQQSQQ